MRRRRFPLVWLALLVTILVACTKQEAAKPAAEVVAVYRATLPADPADAAWNGAPPFFVPLLPQDMVEPRLLERSTAEVRVRAMTDGTRLVFRLEWVDPTKDDLPGAARFSDGCAVQLPAKIQPDVPAPQMGEAGREVQISYWRAAWQAVVDGRKDSIRELYPRAAVDHYPFEAPALEAGSGDQQEMAKRYAPARSLGNRMAGPRLRPVEDLVAEGPGTIRTAAETISEGKGKRADQGWKVVLSRPLPAGLTPGSRSQVAFAVWQGAHSEAGAKKMRSGWVSMLVERRS